MVLRHNPAGAMEQVCESLNAGNFAMLRQVYQNGHLFGPDFKRCNSNAAVWAHPRYKKIGARVIPPIMAARSDATSINAREDEVVDYLEQMAQRPSSNPRSSRMRKIAAVRVDRPDVHFAAVLCVWACLPLYLHHVYADRARVLYDKLDREADHNDDFLHTSERAEKYERWSTQYAEFEDVTGYLLEKLGEGGWPAVCAAVDDIGDDVGEGDSDDCE